MVILIYLLRLMQTAVLIRVLLSWLTPNPNDERIAFFTRPLDKFLKPFQVLIPMGGAFMDVGPVLALLLLQVVERLLIHFL